MSTDFEVPPKQSAASLLSGIFVDLQQLFEQQFQLTRREIEDELNLRFAAASVLAFGVGVLFCDAIVVCLTVAHLLHWLASPSGTDLAWLPLWVCHAIVAAVLSVLGGILVSVGRTRFRSIESCQNPATEIMQEPVPWTTPPK